MFGSKKRHPSDVVYLAYYPYVRPKMKDDVPLHVAPHFEEIQKSFTAFILRWCLQKKIIERDSSENLVPIINSNIASLSYILHIHNFQHLVYTETLNNFLDMIKDNVSFFHTTSLQQLTIGLLGIYEPDFIQYHINRTYAAFDALPMPDPDIHWSEIHSQYPFMWVLLTLNLFVKNFTEA